LQGSLREVVEDLQASRTCTRCGRTFTDLNNLAALRCRWHPGHVQLHAGSGETPIGAYTCCKRPADASSPGFARNLGCVPCDHTSRLDKQHELPMTLSLRDARILFPESTFARLHAMAQHSARTDGHGRGGPSGEAAQGLVEFCGRGQQNLRISRFSKLLQARALSGLGVL